MSNNKSIRSMMAFYKPTQILFTIMDLPSGEQISRDIELVTDPLIHLCLISSFLFILRQNESRKRGLHR